jgi:Ferritin-like domain
MQLSKETDAARLVNGNPSGLSRRSFFTGATAMGAAGALGLGGLLSAPSALGQDKQFSENPHQTAAEVDNSILLVAEIAEALAVTTYTHIIESAPFFTRLPKDDQGYLVAARQEEMSHYLLEKSVTAEATPYTEFFYPPDMFADPQTTLNVLVSLEDAFIAAYLVGVRHFSTADLRVTAARIMGIESDHRTLARVLAGDIAAQDGGPITKITGFQGHKENADPPNNNGYERTLCLTNIDQALNALLPFLDFATAWEAGYDIAKTYPFQSFTPTLPNPLGDFISFTGC